MATTSTPPPHDLATALSSNGAASNGAAFHWPPDAETTFQFLLDHPDCRKPEFWLSPGTRPLLACIRSNADLWTAPPATHAGQRL